MSIRIGSARCATSTETGAPRSAKARSMCIERRGVRQALKAHTGDLVVWGVLRGEGRHTTSDRDDETEVVCSSTLGGLGGLSDQLCVDPFDARGELGVAEQRYHAAAGDLRSSL